MKFQFRSVTAEPFVGINAFVPTSLDNLPFQFKFKKKITFEVSARRNFQMDFDRSWRDGVRRVVKMVHGKIVFCCMFPF